MRNRTEKSHKQRNFLSDMAKSSSGKRLYLGKKLEKLEEKASKEFRSSKPSYEHPPPYCLAKPVLPYEILENEYGIRNMIIIQYYRHMQADMYNLVLHG